MSVLFHHSHRVAVVVDQRHEYQSRILSGVYAYGRVRGWHFRKVPSLKEDVIRMQLMRWNPSGILVLGTTMPEEGVEYFSGIPWVQVGGEECNYTESLVGYDDEAAGRMVATHFLSKGIQSAVAIGNSTHQRASSRVRGFLHVMEEAGLPDLLALDELSFTDISLGPHLPWTLPYPPLIEQLKGLPKPVGVFGWQDSLSEWVLDQCYQQGLDVPNEVLLMGVNNTSLVCNMTFPPMSSVALPFKDAGMIACRQLDYRLQGVASESRIILPPLRVVARESTNRIVEEDALVFQFLQLLKQPESAKWGMDAICGQLQCSRRLLERRVRKALDRSVLELRQDSRLERAKLLLRQDLYSIEGVAKECGYDSVRSLQKLCQEKLGCTPGQYRRQRRLESEDEPIP